MPGLRLFLTVLFISASGAMLHATEVKVMSFNILLGGAHLYPLDVTVQTLQKSAPDVVGIQESDDKGSELSRRLGFHWHPVAQGTRPGGIASRYPFSRTFRQGAEIALPDGKKIYVFSVHLKSSPYEPYGIQDGSLRTEAQAIQSARNSRGSQISEILGEMAPWIGAGAPVFLVGDFNEPSHLDWTEAAGPAGAGLHLMKVRWPTSTAVIEAGLKDAYRTLHPDEVKRKGYTWTPIPSAGEIHDRIDLVYFSGVGVRVGQVQIVGESGGPDVDVVGHSPYPSDHRGVLGHFSF